MGFLLVCLGIFMHKCMKTPRGISLLNSYSYSKYSGLHGIMIAATMYARKPLPPRKLNNIQASRTMVGSILKYSAIPPQTPLIILFTLDL